MPSELENESCAIQIRAKLNELKIKLWEAPYVCGTEAAQLPDDAQLRQLADRLQSDLQIPGDRCLTVLRQLQQHAIDKLQSREEFKRTGLGTLRVRAPTQSGANRVFDVKVKMDTTTGVELGELIGERIGVNYRKIKLVCSGKMLKMVDTLQAQGVQNGATVMLLIMAQCPEETQQEHTIYNKVNKLRADAETLVNENDNLDFLAIENREGRNVHLPKSEKKALLMALMLYEKGKAALRAENYEEALLLFLEADSDFRQTNQEMLDRIHNYALLNLDIVWCYLCLKNLAQLPDAEQRLRLCEEKLTATLRRATVSKGERSSEKAILARLHLLKAVLYFHQNKRDDAKTMFRVVDTELQMLKIDDGCLSTLLEFGFSLAESRVALRDCANDVEAAIEHIQRQREVLQKNERQAVRETKLFKAIGHDGADDRCIDMASVDRLVEMGYPDTLAAIALKRVGNDVNLALNELQTNVAELRQELATTVKLDDNVVQRLVNMGYHERVAQDTLKSVANNFEMALEILITARQNNSYDALLAAATVDSGGAPHVAKKSKTSDAAEAGPSSASSGTAAKQSSETKAPDKTDKAKKEMMDLLFKSFSKDIQCSADSHLDLSLIEEAAILTEYKQLLNMD